MAEEIHESCASSLQIRSAWMNILIIWFFQNTSQRYTDTSLVFLCLSSLLITFLSLNSPYIPCWLICLSAPNSVKGEQCLAQSRHSINIFEWINERINKRLFKKSGLVKTSLCKIAHWTGQVSETPSPLKGQQPHVGPAGGSQRECTPSGKHCEGF